MHYLDTLEGNVSKRHDFCNSLGRQAELVRRKIVELDAQLAEAKNGSREPIASAIASLQTAMDGIKFAEEAIAGIR